MIQKKLKKVLRPLTYHEPKIRNVLKEVSNPKFWQDRYLENNTKWDIGYPTPILVNHLKESKTIGKVCVLGCGNGHDVIEFSKFGNDVYAVDFAEQPLENLRDKTSSIENNINYVNKDIFNLQLEYTNYFDMVYEYTCFCAIDPNRREEYFDMVYSILKKGSILFAIFIPLDKELTDDGPPFGVDIDVILDIVKGRFKVIENIFSDLSIAPRLNREKLLLLKKI